MPTVLGTMIGAPPNSCSAAWFHLAVSEETSSAVFAVLDEVQVILPHKVDIFVLAIVPGNKLYLAYYSLVKHMETYCTCHFPKDFSIFFTQQKSRDAGDAFEPHTGRGQVAPWVPAMGSLGTASSSSQL